MRVLPALEEVERRDVRGAEEFRAGQAAQHARVVTQLAGVRAQAGRGEDEPLAGVRRGVSRLHQHVLDVRAHGDGQVRRQRPRRRRPDQGVRAVQVPALGVAAGGEQPQPDGDGRVLPVGVDVVHLGLGGRQRRLAAPAVPEHPEPRVHEPLVPEGLEGPHDAFHVVQVERLVVVVEVDPAGLAGDVGAPLVGVAQHGGPAGVVELGDAHLLDLGLVLDPELVLGLDLRRQPVGVPAEAALDPAPAHGAVARDDVLDVARQQVPVVRQAVGEGRPVVEDVLVGAVLPGRARVDGGLEGAVGGPEVEHLVLERGKRGVRGNRRVGRRGLGGGHWRAPRAAVWRRAPLSLRASGRCRHGDDGPAHTSGRGHRGTTPLATRRHQGRPAASRSAALTGRTRPVLLPRGRGFFRRLPGDGRIGACATRVAPLRHRVPRQGPHDPTNGTAGSGHRAGARCRALSARSGVHQAQGVKPSSTASRAGSGITGMPASERQPARW